MKNRRATIKDAKGIAKAKKHTIKRWEVSTIEFEEQRSSLMSG